MTREILKQIFADAKENKLDDTTITKIKEAGYTVTEILAI